MGTLAAQDRRELSSSKERLSRSPTSEAVSNGYSSRAGARRSRMNGRPYTRYQHQYGDTTSAE
jgi:hypothetical protein